MDIATVTSTLEAAISDTRLVETAFFQDWKAGKLRQEDITAFAEQFRNVERRIPAFLDLLIDAMPAGEDVDFLERNRRDECGTDTGVSHVELFDRFLAALGGDADVVPSPAMQKLIVKCDEGIDRSVPSALTVLLTYETQAPQIAQLIVDSAEHYDIDDEALMFWKLHAELDKDHAEWITNALVTNVEQPEVITAAAQHISGAWMEFLAERHEMALN
jgi:pyrroloquinoline quinone (PQQ) biosynthesis protein C